MRIVIALLMLFGSSELLEADQIAEGYTILNGKGYAFEIKAPHAWVLDSEIGRDQGLNVVFFPKGSSWDSSKAVCYAQVRTFDNTTRSVSDQVKATLQAFRKTGNPFAESDFHRTMTTQDGSEAKIYYYSGLQSGALYATGYILSKTGLNFITLSAQDKESFQNALSAFDSLVASYEDLTKKKPF